MFKTSKETNLKGKIGKLEIGIQVPECRFKIMQIRKFPLIWHKLFHIF